MVISKKLFAAAERVARVHLLHVHRSAVDARGGKLGKAAIDQLDGNTRTNTVGANGTDAIPAGAIRQLDDVGGSPLGDEVGDRRGIVTRAAVLAARPAYVVPVALYPVAMTPVAWPNQPN